MPGISAYADTAVPAIDEEISSAYEIAHAPSSNLSIANKTAYCVSSTSGNNAVRLSNSISGLDSGTYRLKSVFTLTDKQGKSETITVYSDEQKVS